MFQNVSEGFKMFQNFNWDILQMRLTFHSHYGTWRCHWPLNFRIFLSTEYRKSLAVQEVLYTLLQARLWAVIFTSITCTISVTDCRVRASSQYICYTVITVTGSADFGFIPDNSTSNSHIALTYPHTVTKSAVSGFNPLLRRPQGPQGCLEKPNCPLSLNLVVWCTKIGSKS